MDNIDIGPERRNFADYRLEREWEINGQVSYLNLINYSIKSCSGQYSLCSIFKSSLVCLDRQETTIW